jgi:X-X-X-Leu-X-X-Gly heptad repeat protein
MTEPGDEFETFLKTRTVLPSGMSDDDKLEPPKALDAIVLKEAREAIRARQQLNQTPRWATPVALAATILLCLSIVLNVSLNTNHPAANLRRMTAATEDKASPAPASPVSEGERREKVPDGASPNEAILPEAKVVEPRAPRPPVVAEAAAPAPAQSPRPNGSAANNADALAKRSGALAQAQSEVRSAANSAADKAPQLADRSGTPAQAQSEVQSGANSAADKAPQLADRSRAPIQAQSEATSAADSIATLAARSYAGTAAARAPAPASEPAASDLAGATVTPSSPSDATAAPSPAAARAAPPPSTAEAQQRDQSALAERKAAVAPPHPQDPKTWLQQIAALRAEGKTAQADAEMQRFRATFPAYPAKPGPPAPSEPSK